MHTFVANFLRYVTFKNYLNLIIFSQVFAKVERVTFFETQCRTTILQLRVDDTSSNKDSLTYRSLPICEQAMTSSFYRQHTTINNQFASVLLGKFVCYKSIIIRTI